jgi:hypothetical protein
MAKLLSIFLTFIIGIMFLCLIGVCFIIHWLFNGMRRACSVIADIGFRAVANTHGSSRSRMP